MCRKRPENPPQLFFSNLISLTILNLFNVMRHFAKYVNVQGSKANCGNPGQDAIASASAIWSGEERMDD
jgi:hypothetical protein